MAASRAGRSWKTSLAGAIAVHVVLVALAVLTTKIPSAPKEPPSVDIRLVQPWRPPVQHKRRPPPARAASSAPVAPSPALSAPAPNAVVAPQPAPASGPSPGDIAAVRNVLRGTLGCANATLYRLTPEEQAKCEHRFQARVDPNQQYPVLIDPAKRAAYDAALREDAISKRMAMGPPGLGLKAPFDTGR